MIVKPDLLWKFIIKGRFVELLHYFFGKYVSQIDFERRFEFLDKELEQLFPESASGQRYVDFLVKVWLKNGREKWFLIHVEVQGYFDKTFPLRMYQYHYRIFDRFGVAVTSLAILTDASKRWKPTRYRFSAMGTSVIFRFNLYKLAEQNLVELLASENIFGIIMAAAFEALGRKSDPEKLEIKVRLVRLLKERGYATAEIRDILAFIKYFTRFEKPEYLLNFDREMDTIMNFPEPKDIIEAIHQAYAKDGFEKGMEAGMQDGKKVGIQQGIQQGLQQGLQQGVEAGKLEGLKQAIRNMLLHGYPKKEIQIILDVSPELVAEVEAELGSKEN